MANTITNLMKAVSVKREDEVKNEVYYLFNIVKWTRRVKTTRIKEEIVIDLFGEQDRFETIIIYGKHSFKEIKVADLFGHDITNTEVAQGLKKELDKS